MQVFTAAKQSEGVDEMMKLEICGITNPEIQIEYKNVCIDVENWLFEIIILPVSFSNTTDCRQTDITVHAPEGTTPTLKLQF